MTISVIINGAHGRMGQEAVIAVENDPALALVAALTRGDDLSASIKDTKAQVVVDLTTPDSVFENTKIIIENDACPVIGTSGLTLPQIEEIQHISQKRKRGGLIAPNFSLGAVLLMQASALVAQYLPDAEIIEYHRAGKKDAPSFTAKKTAEMINNARKQAAPEIVGKDLDARGHNHHDVQIHSLRLPGVVAQQDVVFGGVDETLTISHNSLHRKSFMPGIVLSCKKVPSLDQVVYGLEHLL